MLIYENWLNYNDKNIKKSTYKNAISYKWGNRRLTVIKGKDGTIGFDFRIATKDDKPTVKTKRKCCVSFTQLKISETGARLLASAINELLNNNLR